MPSPVLTEQFYSGAFLIREANGYLSRDQAIINNTTGSDMPLQGGLILSQTAPASASATVLGTNTGNGTVGAVTVGGVVQAGNYIINLESATGFTVEDPTGVEVGHGTTGTAFNAGGVSFTITAGATAFVPGDSFVIVVAIADGTYTPYTGASPAAGILYNRTLIGANSTRKVTVIRRLAEVNVGEIQWDASVLAAGNMAALQSAALAQLAALGIVFRQVAPSAG